MSLAPAAKFVLGDLEYTTHALSLSVDLAALPGAGSFKVVLPKQVEVSGAPGDRATLELDGGEGEETVLTGKIRAIGRGLDQIEVLAADGAADLAALRPAATYNRQSARDVIRAIAGDAGVDLGTAEIDLSLAAFVAHQKRTAAEQIAEVALLGGALAYFSNENSLTIRSLDASRPEIALKFGREIRSYRVSERAAAPKQVRIGNGGAGAADAPDALRPSAGYLPGDAADPGADAIWVANGLLRTPAAATGASRAADGVAARRTKTLRATAFLLPKLRPGVLIEVQELPGDLSGGPWCLTRVRHRLGENAGETYFEAISAESGGLLGSLGGLF